MVVFGLSPIFKLGLVVNYFIQSDYYANVLCINQDKPKMNCNGKCHLRKEIAQTQRKTDENLPEIIYQLQLSQFVLNEYAFYLLGPEIIVNQDNSFAFVFNQSTLDGHLNGIFRPPIT